MRINYRKKWNIIIWGMGKQGEWWLNNFIENWVDIINVIGIVDSNPRESVIYNKYPQMILTIEQVQILCHLGKADGVFIATSGQNKADILARLFALDIIEIELPDRTFCFASEIGERQKLICNNGSFFVSHIKDCYVRKDPKNNIIWIFRDNGPIVREISAIRGRDLNQINSVPLCIFDNTKVLYIENTVCALTFVNADNYGHFVCEILDKLIIMEKNHYTGKYLLNRTSFIEQYVEILGIADRVIYIEKQDNRILCFKNLIIPDAINHSVKKTQYDLIEWSRRLDEDVLSNIQGDFPKRLFVKRIGTRKALGIDNVLNKYGFKTMIPEEHSVMEQLAFFCNAEIVIAPHGAACPNMIYMKPGTHFIELFGRNYIVPRFHINYAMVNNINYHMVVEDYPNGEVYDNMVRNTYLDYYVNNDVLEATICSCIGMY